MSADRKIPVSVLILTRDEEANIAETLESVRAAEEAIVLDSMSDDRTVEIAASMGARIFQRQFDDFSTHRNWALDHVNFHNAWILILDADERPTSRLWSEIAETIAGPRPLNGYFVRRQIHFLGRRIRFCGLSRNWALKLLRRGKGRYEDRIVHEHLVIEGPAGYLASPLINCDRKGIGRYFDRHNAYSTMEAIEIHKSLRRRGAGESGAASRGVHASLLGSQPERNRFVKRLVYRHLPARWAFRFLWMYLFRLGILDGRIGLRFCFLQSFYEYQIDLKLEELREREKG